MARNSARPLRQALRDEMYLKDQIVAILSESPKTIPQITEALGEYPIHEVVSWVAALWRFQVLEETGKPDADGFYAYELRSDGESE